jgi:hypothetical protein
MRAREVFTILSVLLISLGGCRENDGWHAKATEEVSVAKSYFDLLRTGHADVIENSFDPAFKDAEFASEISEMVATVPVDGPSSVKTIFAHPDCVGNICVYSIMLDYTYSFEHLLFNVVLRKAGGHTSIIGMHVRIVPESVIEESEFKLSNKGVPQYTVLLAAIFCAIFTLYVLVLCIRSRIGPQKWIWAAFISIGISRLGVNWATGRINFRLFALQVLSFSAFAASYRPWIISVSLPLGAILFLSTRTVRSRHQSAHSNSMSRSDKEREIDGA